MKQQKTNSFFPHFLSPRSKQVLGVSLPLGYGGVVGFEPGVAEGGYSLSGGVGFQSRLYGLGIDNVLSLRMVTADANVLVASPIGDADLYFALRGAGNGNYGVVTELKVQLHPIAKRNRGQELLSFEVPVSIEKWADFCVALGTMDVPRGFFVLFEGGIVNNNAFPVSFLYTGDLEQGKHFLVDNIVPMLSSGDDDEPEYEVEVLSWYNYTVSAGNFEGI